MGALLGGIISLAIAVLTILFKIFFKLKFGLAFTWFFLIAFPLNRWASANEFWAWGVLIALVTFSTVCWIVKLVRYIKERQIEKRNLLLEIQIRHDKDMRELAMLKRIQEGERQRAERQRALKEQSTNDPYFDYSDAELDEEFTSWFQE